METQGQFAPTSVAEVRERYDSLRPLARTLVREVTSAMDFSADEYDDRVSEAVVETACDVLFASDLAVHVGSSDAFDAWLEAREADAEVVTFGSQHVDNVVWHDAAAVDTIVAATYQDERTAAVETLRRQALGRCYRDVI